MTWSPNRRFKRDIAQLTRQGNSISAAPNGRGGFVFYANGGDAMTPDDLMISAYHWRKPFTQEQLNRAKKDAEELCEMLGIKE